MEYSKDINSLLGSLDSDSDPVIDDPKMVLKRAEPTSIKAAWELMEIFYADKQSQPWQLERRVDWLADFDCLLSSNHPTVHSKLVNFQNELSELQVIEDDPNYWDVVSSILAVGWLDTVLKLLNWPVRPLLNISQTELLLNKLQESSMAKLRPDFIVVDLPSEALSCVRLALASNLGRAILEE